MNAPSSLSQLLASLRVGLHVLFAGLLVVAMAGAGGAGNLTAPVVVLVTALAGVYLAGTVAEARGVTTASSPWAPAWLAVVLAVWAGLVALSAEFIWLLFPLVFLILHVLPWAVGLVVVAVAFVVATVLPVVTGHTAATVGGFLGPAIGTLAAVAGYRVYTSLRAEAEEQRRTVETLRATQAQLADTQHEAGRLAERERLAREIHDTLAQGLNSILLLSRAAEKSVAAEDGAAAGEQVRAIGGAAADNLAEARRFVAGLSSPALLDAVPDALGAVVDKERARLRALGRDLRVQLTYTGQAQRQVPEEVAAAVVRVVQEALANALRHAEAKNVVVTYGVWPEAVTVDVVDDGRGFDPARGGEGFGLPGLHARVAELGGVFSVESRPGHGAAVAARLPTEERRL